MSLVQLFVPTEVAHDTVHELGELGDVQFKDVRIPLPLSSLAFPDLTLTNFISIVQLNPSVNPFQRSFVGEIRRIDDMSRRTRFFSSQIDKEKDVVPVRALYDCPPVITVGPRAAQTVDELDTALAQYEVKLTKLNESYATLSERARELTEARYVLRETAVFFDKVSEEDREERRGMEAEVKV